METSLNTTQVTIKQKVGRDGIAIAEFKIESTVLRYTEKYNQTESIINKWISAVGESLRDEFIKELGEDVVALAEKKQRQKASKTYDAVAENLAEWETNVISKISEISPDVERETLQNFVNACIWDLTFFFKKSAEDWWYSEAVEKKRSKTVGSSIRPTSLSASAGELEGKKREKYIGDVKRAARNYQKTHVVFLSAITRNEDGEESTEYHVARQLTKILRARGIPVFWWEDPEGKESDNRKYSEWRTIGTKIAMGLAFSSVFIGLSFDSVKFNGEDDRHSFRYTWLSKEEPYRDRYKNFCYEVNTFAGFIKKDKEEKTQESFTEGIITDQSALPSERTMLMFSYGSQDEVKENEPFENYAEQFTFEQVEYRTGEPLEDCVNRIVGEILSALYADLLTPGKQAGENHNNVYRQDIFDMSEHAYRHDKTHDKTKETLEHWFKTVHADEKLTADREGRDGGDYETYFHHAPNTPSDRYFKYAIVDEKGEDVAVGARPPFEIFLERKYSNSEKYREIKTSYDVCLVVNDWNDVCLYQSEDGRFFDYVYSESGGTVPTLSAQSAEKYPLAKYTSFSVSGSQFSSQKTGRKPIAQEGGPEEFGEIVGLIGYKKAGGKYYLYKDLDDETVTTLTCTLAFRKGEGREEGKKYFCAFKYAVKKVIRYDVIPKKSEVTIRLSEKLTEKDLNGTELKVCLVSSGPNHTYEPYGRGSNQSVVSLDPKEMRYDFKNPPSGSTWKLAFADENEGRDALVVFLKEYQIRGEKKWSSKKRLLRCPYCSKPLLKKNKIKEGKYSINREGAMSFSEGQGDVVVVNADMSDPEGAEKFLGKHYFEEGELHCLECEMKRYKSLLDVDDDVAQKLRGNGIIDAILPKDYERGLTLGYVGDQESGKSSFIAESVRLELDGQVLAKDYIDPSVALLPLAPHKRFTNANLLKGGAKLMNLIAHHQVSVTGLKPHVHFGYVKIPYGPNVHATEATDKIRQWLEAYPFIMQCNAVSKEEKREQGGGGRSAFISCFDFPGGLMGQLDFLKNIDAMILFLDPTTKTYGNIAKTINQARRQRAERSDANGKQKKDNDLILAVVLCKFDKYDGSEGNFEEWADLQFNCNSYVCTTPPCLTERQYEGSKLSRYIECCSREVEGWLESQNLDEDTWNLLNSIPKRKFFAVSSLGNRHSITGDPSETGAPSQVRFMDNGRGLELVYTWLAYQAGIIE